MVKKNKWPRNLFAKRNAPLQKEELILDTALSLLDLDDFHVEALEERLSLTNSGCGIETETGPVFKY